MVREWAVLTKSGRVVTVIKSEHAPKAAGIYAENYSIIPVENAPQHLIEAYRRNHR